MCSLVAYARTRLRPRQPACIIEAAAPSEPILMSLSVQVIIDVYYMHTRNCSGAPSDCWTHLSAEHGWACALQTNRNVIKRCPETDICSQLDVCWGQSIRINSTTLYICDRAIVCILCCFDKVHSLFCSMQCNTCCNHLQVLWLCVRSLSCFRSRK